MDGKVNDFLNNTPAHLEPHNEYPIFRSQGVYLSNGATPMASHIRDQFMENYQTQFWFEYAEKHLDMNMHKAAAVEWNCISRYLRNNKLESSSLIKIINNQINTMEVNQRWNTSTSSMCPVCKVCSEKSSHLLQCSHKCIQIYRNQSLKKIKESLTKENTEPMLLSMIMSIMENYALKMPQNPPKISAEPRICHLRDIFFSIQNIGWLNFHKGFLPKKLIDYQHQHYVKQGGIKGNIDTWSNLLVKLLLSHFKLLWNRRCKIVEEEKTSTLLQRTREMNIERCVIT